MSIDTLPQSVDAPAAGEIPPSSLRYCESRFQTVRWNTREVRVGDIGIGGDNPIRVQSMTTTLTDDVDATVKQSIELAEAGCDVIRITAPTTKAARCLGDIRRKFRASGFLVPLVADIHFAPKAAMEAVKHVEKVRINPGNYADRKKFAVREYSDGEYETELQRLYEAFSPIVLECRNLGKAMRIGTNHGSLSDRIMNRFGDSPEGMVQSALEFIRIAESHGFHDIVLSMKASNPKVMIAAYRLAVARMRENGMNYPLHLGVTEAGGGEDGRVKSAIGIGSLLYDGIGDTIRVSLTEDPVQEVPVGRELAKRAMMLWRPSADRSEPPSPSDGIHPYEFSRRSVSPIEIGKPGLRVGGAEPPAVIVRSRSSLTDEKEIIREVCAVQSRFKDARIEGLLVQPQSADEFKNLPLLAEALHTVLPLIVVDCRNVSPRALKDDLLPLNQSWGVMIKACRSREEEAEAAAATARRLGATLFAELSAPEDVALAKTALSDVRLVLTLDESDSENCHTLGRYRKLAALSKEIDADVPLWVRTTRENAIAPDVYTTAGIIEASMLAGPLLCDGIGDLISAEIFSDPAQATAMSFNILQGARARITKTEYVACPSCGRTLFDLQSTTARIREKTDHLKGVTIAVMGCIVNGPGEMADADFGYVGGAPGKINLYVGKECVQVGIPQDSAVDELISLIRSHGKWKDPE
ncbi:MAG: (E)-4-hydroxy-3-methylbut-2-enyl-diphosphate synthase [Verrucomicrobiota bacterium]